MILIKLFKKFFNIPTDKSTVAFELYCKNNPSANACKIYDV